MVVWLIRCFFLLLGVAALAWLADALYQRTRPSGQAEAVVAQKSWTKFPRTVISVRRDRRDCRVAFRLTREERTLDLAVPEDVFQALQKGEAGILAYQGARFRSFTRADGSQVCHVYGSRPSQEE